jgi:hypothetical protein
MAKRRWLALCALGLLVQLSPFLHASQGLWQDNGQVICNYSSSQDQQQTVPDGSGGAIIVWRDSRGPGNIFAQRVNSDGVYQWTLNGVMVSGHSGLNPQLLSDGTGGAIITWIDSSIAGSYYVYAQHLNASGARQWTANGVVVSDYAILYNDYQTNPHLISDGAGGAIIAWNGGDASQDPVFAQRINAAGNPQWTATGALVDNSALPNKYVQIVPDGSGGAIITWGIQNGAIWGVAAQRLNAAGTAQWALNGISVCTFASNHQYAQPLADGSGGAMIAWQDDRGTGMYGIYAQRVNASGVLQWAADGVAICTASAISTMYAENAYYLHIVSDNTGGALLAWQDERAGGDDIYAQHVNGSGSSLWASNGVAVCAGAVSIPVTNPTRPKITPGFSGDAFLTWEDYRDGSPHIYAQRLNNSGNALWTPNGEVICNSLNYQEFPELINDGTGGVIISWLGSGIFVQRMVKPKPKITGINSPGARGMVFHAAITGFNFQDDRGQVTAIALTRTALVISATNINIINSGYVTCEFDLSSAALGDWGVVAKDSFMQSSQEPIMLTILAAMPTQTPTPSPSITPTLPPASTPTPTASVASTDRLVEDTSAMEHRIIRPGQGQPLKVTIALVRREKVLVSIYSRQGMLIKTLADSELDAGTHEFSWDGVTQNGRPTGSGIYVLVIRTDSLMENRKFVLIR